MSEHFLRARRLAGRVIGGRTVGPARAVGMVAGLGVCFGFIGVVFAIACESFFSVPDGVVAKDYLTIGCREAESDLFVTVSTIDYFEIKSAAPEIELSYGEYYLGEGEASDGAGRVHRVDFRRVSGSFFSLLGVDPALGRVVFEGNTDVAVISAEMWNDIFGSDPDVLGEAVRIGEGVTVPIVGVADTAFKGVFDSEPDFWVLESGARGFGDGTVTIRNTYYLFGALRAGVTFSALQSLVEGYRFPMTEQRNDRLEAVRGLELHPDARREMRQRLMWLAMVVALLLALAFTGFVDFLAADHAVREDAHAVRLAVGATPADVFRENVSRHAMYGLGIVAVGLASFSYVADTLLAMDPFASALGELGWASRRSGSARA